MRGGVLASAVIGLALVMIVGGCAASASQPIDPPRIEMVGMPTEVRIGATTIEYEFADGETRRIDPNGWRAITPHAWGGELVILGTDANGPFVAAFLPQGGLPDDCYVENDMGTDRGSHIEIREILWRKAPDFTPASPVSAGDTYPFGTRFCFTDEGMIGSTVAP